jgi:membrane protein implicated in regulation of membrane protease activity
MIALIWLGLAVALVALEMHHMAFYALFGAVGAIVAAGLAVLLPSAVALQVGCALAATAVGVFLVRPYVSKAFLRTHGEAAARGVHGGFVGETVLVLDTVSSTPGGHVRLIGERWLARTASDEVLPPESKAIVVEVSGTTLTVSALPAPERLGESTPKLEQLREHYEHIINNRIGHTGDISDGGDLRPSADDQHRPTG